MRLVAGLLFLGLIYFGLCAVVARIAMREASIRRWYRRFFAYTALPFFTVAMLFNIWVMSKLAPEILGYIAANTSATGSGSSVPMLAGFVSTPIAVFLTLLWYWLIKGLERLTRPSRSSSVIGTRQLPDRR